jgi:hypothetical protein
LKGRLIFRSTVENITAKAQGTLRREFWKELGAGGKFNRRSEVENITKKAQRTLRKETWEEQGGDWTGAGRD